MSQEEIAHLKLEMATLNMEKNEAVTNQSQLQQTFDLERQESASGRISLERELQELKDRNTALEHQLVENAETINDQSKVYILV